MTTAETSVLTEFYTWGSCPRNWRNMTSSWAESAPINMPVNITEETELWTWGDCPSAWSGANIEWERSGSTDYGLETLAVCSSCESKRLTYNKKVAEGAITLSEAINKTAKINKAEQIFATGTLRAGIVFQRLLAEALTISRMAASTIGKPFDEQVSFESKNCNSVQKEYLASLVATPLFGRIANFRISVPESLLIYSTANKDVKKILADAFDIQKAVCKTPRISKLDNFGFEANIDRLLIIKRLFQEVLHVSVEMQKLLVIVKEEAAGFYGAIIEACRAVLSNIAISEGEISVNEFLEATKTAPGYTDFVEFKVGEYEYKNALVRLVVESSTQQAQPAVSSVVMHVDIPDMHDRGTVEVEDASMPTKVFFSKKYYNPPEVVVTLKGGNTGDGLVVPNIVSTDKKDDSGDRYFEVELLNADGERVTGLITWQSVGY